MRAAKTAAPRCFFSLWFYVGGCRRQIQQHVPFICGRVPFEILPSRKTSFIACFDLGLSRPPWALCPGYCNYSIHKALVSEIPLQSSPCSWPPPHTPTSKTTAITLCYFFFLNLLAKKNCHRRAYFLRLIFQFVTEIFFEEARSEHPQAVHSPSGNPPIAR